jgi:hypothetical protein
MREQLPKRYELLAACHQKCGDKKVGPNILTIDVPRLHYSGGFQRPRRSDRGLPRQRLGHLVRVTRFATTSCRFQAAGRTGLATCSPFIVDHLGSSGDS